jgi:hypothetical protein
MRYAQVELDSLAVDQERERTDSGAAIDGAPAMTIAPLANPSIGQGRQPQGTPDPRADPPSDRGQGGSFDAELWFG